LRETAVGAIRTIATPHCAHSGGSPLRTAAAVTSSVGWRTGLISDGAADGLGARRRLEPGNLLARHFRHAAIRGKAARRAFGLVTVGNGWRKPLEEHGVLARETRRGEHANAINIRAVFGSSIMENFSLNESSYSPIR